MRPCMIISGGPREAATTDPTLMNICSHLRSRFRALEMVDCPSDRAEPRRSLVQAGRHLMMNWLAVPLIVALLAMHATHRCFAQEGKSSEAATEATPQSIDELLLFFPSKFPTGDWAPKDLQFKDVFFSAQDETKLHGNFSTLCPRRYTRR